MSSGYISSLDKHISVGDPMKVLVIDIDEHDRVKLSRRRALEELGEEDELAAVIGDDEDGGGDDEGGDGERRPPRRRGGRGGRGNDKVRRRD